MEIVTGIDGLMGDIVDIAYESYLREIERHAFLNAISRDDMCGLIAAAAPDMRWAASVEDGGLTGYIACKADGRDDGLRCDIPLWGCGARGERRVNTISRLFCNMAGSVFTGGKALFSAHFYAHDEPVQRLFTHMQFGFMAEKDVREISGIEHPAGVCVRELGAKELSARWSEVWGLLARLINHLRESPIFYPCAEFTEEAYRQFFLDEGTTVYAAEENGALIGMIEANGERHPYLYRGEGAANVGEVYVLPERRGEGIAQALLSYMDARLLEKGVKYQWVEHGTANPTARGFWNKYFEPFEYELERLIEL